MFCTSCGSKNSDEAKFCAACGSPIAVLDDIAGQAGRGPGLGNAPPAIPPSAVSEHSRENSQPPLAPAPPANPGSLLKKPIVLFGGGLIALCLLAIGFAGVRELLQPKSLPTDVASGSVPISDSPNSAKDRSEPERLSDNFRAFMKAIPWGSAPTNDLAYLPSESNDKAARYRHPQKLETWAGAVEMKYSFVNNRLFMVASATVPMAGCEVLLKELQATFGPGEEGKGEDKGNFTWHPSEGMSVIWARDKDGSGAFGFLNVDESRIAMFSDQSTAELERTVEAARIAGKSEDVFAKNVEKELKWRAERERAAEEVAEYSSVIAALAMGTCPNSSPTCKAAGYSFESVGLNEGGVVAWLGSEDGTCGSNGCHQLLIAHIKGVWTVLADADGAIRIKPTRTNGFADLELVDRGSGNVFRFIWNGSEYSEG